MTKVNNRRLIRRLAVRELKKDRKMSFVVILSIVLTCVLFTVLATIGGSLINGSQQETMRQVGASSMAGLKYVLPEDAEKVAADSKTRNVSSRIIVGQVSDERLRNFRAEVNCALSLQNAEAMFCAPTEGRLPESFDEVAVSTLFLDELGLPHELGITVPMKMIINDRAMTTVEQPMTLCGFWQGDRVSMAQQCWVSKAFQEKYAPTPDVSFYDTDLTCLAGYYQVDFDFANSWDIEGKTEKLMKRLYPDGKVPGYGVNWAYAAGSIDGGTITAIVIFALIIFSAGYLIIYNIFSINISANIRSYGLLKTIGTTEKQIRRMVRTQARIYCAAGIPFGLVTGLVIGKVSIGMILRIINLISAQSYAVSPKMMAIICIISALFTFETVMISSRKPCKAAAKASPIEALRYNETANIKNEDKQTKKLSPRSIAKSSMLRSRRKIVVVVLSLTLSIILTNTLFTFLGGLDMDKYLSNMIVGDFIIKRQNTPGNRFDGTYNTVTPEQIEEIASLDGVKSADPVYCEHGELMLEGTVLERYDALEAAYGKTDSDYTFYAHSKGCISSDLYGIPQNILADITPKEGSIDAEKFASGDYALVYTKYINLDDSENDPIDDLCKTGDTITVRGTNEQIKTFKVMAVSDIPYPLSTQEYDMLSVHITIPESAYMELTDDRSAMLVKVGADKEDIDRAGTQLDAFTELSENSLICKSKSDYMDEYKDLTKVIRIVGGALCGILALIGILNFVNAVVTGIISRKRELAMMNAVGMTGRQLKAMLMWEGVHYSVLTAVSSIVLSSLLSLLLLRNLAKEMIFFSYSFNILPILVCLPILILLSAAIPATAYKVINRESIVDRLREN
ncbi:putative ABC transport system permease protein [Ruminococcus sp. YE71]|uniref:ABC transporter permease n=1 Tax=unclassified Ruminococcus TaxID=2608920 RepID=UPI00088C38B5|nr:MULTISPECIES: ABC transporter permease [unclassified Ruminococcus]SDA11850.1 putative ABC transport system permease protein [Ruminococcus sp. YE78]SFW15854.1 putative ABC transport system permease protein [Ruminococcus sp. YE71]